MRALEELPNLTKDRLLPIVHLRPWVAAHRLENAIEKISEAYGDDRPIVIAVGERELPNERPVFTQLETLRNPDNGFQNWCSFIEAHENYIPVIQLGDVQQEAREIERLFNLGRGLVLIIESRAFPVIAALAQRVGQRTNGGQDVCIVIDFGAARRNHTELLGVATDYINTVRQHAPRAFIALSASSFPDSFVGLADQQIYERELFDRLNLPDLIYSDRGSARVERQNGGGGQPAPRIDYPLSISWKFYRSEDLVEFAGYQQQARLLIADRNIWNPNFRVWGTQMIERTAAGDSSAIGSPSKATAARINLHLQRQAFYSDPNLAQETDEDWSG